MLSEKASSIKMADEVDVEALLEAPYRKQQEVREEAGSYSQK